MEARSSRRVLILVNSPSMTASTATSLWANFDTIMCADGGANRLYDGLAGDGEEDRRETFVPHFIKGDLDSLRPDVRAFYVSKGCQVLLDGNQDTNDLEKCLELAVGLPSLEGRESGKHVVCVLGAFGSRFDQTMASVHCMYAFQHAFDRIVLMGEGNVAFLLAGGLEIEHRITLTEKEGPGVSLLPVGGIVESITTTGLAWNLNGQSLQIGKLISSSNKRQDDCGIITVTTSHDVLFSCSYKDM